MRHTLTTRGDDGAMPTPRSPATRQSKPRPKAATASAPTPRWTERLRPDVSRGGIARLSGHVMGVFAVVGVLTVAAGWHASGMVRRGEIQRMVRMSATLPPPAAESKNRGRLDKGRLEALAASAAR